MLTADFILPRTTSRSRWMNGALLALLLYLAWTLVTYLLEGNLRTLLRPEAMRDRLAYALVANVAVGVVVTALLLGKLVR